MISRLLQRLDMGGWRLSTRIVALSLVLLMLVQTAGFMVLHASIERNARTQIATELALGDRVWRRLLEQNAEKLRQGAALLSADFGFRAAVTSGDIATIRSALENQGDRIGATVTALLDPQLNLRASNDTPDARAVAGVLAHITVPLSGSELGGTVALVGHTPYQFVMVPLRAPLVIGWVLMGFPIDQRLADDMRSLSGLHLALLTQAIGQPPQMGLSTLPDTALAALQTADGMVAEVTTDGDTLVTRNVDLHAVAGNVRTVLLRSLNEVLAPFQQVQLVLLVITVLGLLLFGLGSAWTALRVTTPLRSLVHNAERLGRGQYDQPIQHTERRDEIGDLANAFDQMRKSVFQQQEEIQKQAYWDRLTRLRNRVGFRNDVRDAIANHQADGQHPQTPLSVITLNLNRFKHVNDILGYTLGDRLLVAVAERLHARMEDGALVARLGGDEFSILLPYADADTAMAIAARIAHAFDAPLSFADQTVDLSASMGIACWPLHAPDTDTLLNRAEVAMYAAKRKTTVLQLYDPELDSTSKQTLSLLSELRHAVEHNELRLFLQPKIALNSGKVIAAEALVRWQHPLRGLVPPDAFIPFAEQTGFVRQLTLWMFDEAARQWAGLQLPDQALRISVNLSTRDLLDLDFPARLDVLLAKHRVAPEGFCLEITESAIMDDPQRAESTLKRLSERGFKLSIDDFGTGYSSLAYLKRLPVDELKIDKSFVMGMERDPDDAKIVRSTIDLAHNMGLSVVAEGVENLEIWQLLRAQNCDEAQGYYMSKPLPVDAFKVWRERWAERAEI